MAASYCSCGRRKGRWWIEKMLPSAMSSDFALFEIQLSHQALVKVISYYWSVTMAKLSSISCATCNLFLHHHITTLRCKTNITTSSFSSCNKCIRNRSKFLLTEQFFILIQQKSQLNKLKMMLLIIQKMYWESEFVTYSWSWASS